MAISNSELSYVQFDPGSSIGLFVDPQGEYCYLEPQGSEKIEITGVRNNQ